MLFLTSLLLVAEARLRLRRPRATGFMDRLPCLVWPVLRGGGGVLDFGGYVRAAKSKSARSPTAIEEAVGRATEMGRSVLFVPGIQDVSEIQTIAGIGAFQSGQNGGGVRRQGGIAGGTTLVMVTARETVQAFLAAGRLDAYNEDLIYYVTDEQFGYVAYLSGMMVREEPAACIYMGCFYAESLILAETGNSVGPFRSLVRPCRPAALFVAADYTLIGEEFTPLPLISPNHPRSLAS